MRRLFTTLLITLMLITPAIASPKLPNANEFIKSAKGDIVNAVDSSDVGASLSGILLLVYKVGYAVAVIALFYFAIQLMIAPAQKKSEVKSALTPYIIGLLLLVAGVPIATMIIRMFLKIF